MMHVLLQWAFFCAVLCCASFHATSQINQAFDDGAEWKEQEIKLPPYPKRENLVSAQISGITGFTFLVDVTSIEVGSDGIVRFVVLARSMAGAENISFEGIRCSTRERRIYATGRVNGTWFPPRNSEWVAYQGTSVNSYHESFARQYFCIDRTVVPSAARAIELLRRK